MDIYSSDDISVHNSQYDFPDDKWCKHSDVEKLEVDNEVLLSAIEEAAYLLHLNLDEKDEPDAEQCARRRIIDAYQAVIK